MEYKLYCDGACRGNQNDENIGAWAYIFTNAEEIVLLKGGDTAYNTTNNKMELMSLIAALEALIRQNYQKANINVYMDSEYVVKGIKEWSPNWIKQGWKNSKGKPVQNQMYWKELLALLEQFPNITISWVRREDKGITIVDKIANILINKKEEELL